MGKGAIIEFDEALKRTKFDEPALSVPVKERTKSNRSREESVTKSDEAVKEDKDAAERSDRARKGGIALRDQRGRDYYVQMARRAVAKRVGKKGGGERR